MKEKCENIENYLTKNVFSSRATLIIFPLGKSVAPLWTAVGVGLAAFGRRSLIYSLGNKSLASSLQCLLEISFTGQVTH